MPSTPCSRPAQPSTAAASIICLKRLPDSFILWTGGKIGLALEQSIYRPSSAGLSNRTPSHEGGQADEAGSMPKRKDGFSWIRNGYGEEFFVALCEKKRIVESYTKSQRDERKAKAGVPP